MAWIKSVALSLALGMGSSALIAPAFAEDAPAKAKEEKKEEKKVVKGPKLWGVWDKLASLTAEQRVKIDELHKKNLAEKRKLDDQEEADIMAVLTDEQKVELQANKEAAAAEKKAKDAEKAKEKEAKDAEKNAKPKTE